jgi:hypothetical protein
MARINTTESLPFPLAKPNPDTPVTEAENIGYGESNVKEELDSVHNSIYGGGSRNVQYSLEQGGLTSSGEASTSKSVRLSEPVAKRTFYIKVNSGYKIEGYLKYNDDDSHSTKTTCPSGTTELTITDTTVRYRFDFKRTDGENISPSESVINTFVYTDIQTTGLENRVDELEDRMDDMNVTTYDISAAHSNTSYASLSAALGNSGANVPNKIKKGGLTVKFINSTNSKYEIWNLLSSSWSTDVANWKCEGVTDAIDVAYKNSNVKSALDAIDTAIIGSEGEDVNISLEQGGLTSSGEASTGNKVRLSQPISKRSFYIELNDGYYIDGYLTYNDDDSHSNKKTYTTPTSSVRIDNPSVRYRFDFRNADSSSIAPTENIIKKFLYIDVATEGIEQQMEGLSQQMTELEGDVEDMEDAAYIIQSSEDTIYTASGLAANTNSSTSGVACDFIAGHKYKVTIVKHGNATLNVNTSSSKSNADKIDNLATMSASDTEVTNIITATANASYFTRYAPSSITYDITIKELTVEKYKASDVCKEMLDILPTKKVDYWGDSITQGDNRGADTNRPTVMQSLLGNDWVVNNYGASGEKSNAIATRRGGWIAQLLPGITIPADGSYTECGSFLKDQEGRDLDFNSSLYQSKKSIFINPCIINGVECTLYKADISDTIKVKRNEAGSAIVIDRPTYISMPCLDLNVNSVMIILMGQNGGFNNDSDVLIRQLDAMIKAGKSERYLIVGLTCVGYAPEQANVNAELAKHFGKHFIDAYTYMVTPIYAQDGVTIQSCYALADMGITPTADDLSKIAEGKTPPSIMGTTSGGVVGGDTVHFNGYGYTVIANLEYERGKILGYW